MDVPNQLGIHAIKHWTVVDFRKLGAEEAKQKALEMEDIYFPCLERLYLTSLSLGEGVFRSIAKALRLGLLPALTTVDFSSCGFRKEGLLEFATVIQAGHLRSLESLYLGGNPMGDYGVQAITAVCQSDTLPVLKTLDLNGCSFGQGLIQGLSTAIQRGHLCTLESLNLGDNPLGDENVGALAAMFQLDALPALKTLDLNYCRFAGEGARALANAIGGDHLRSLETLNLCNNLMRDDGVGALAAVFQSETIPALKTLDLNYCRFGGEGAKALATAIGGGHMRSLETLNLGKNQLGDDGIGALAAVFQLDTLPALKTLDLNFCSFREAGAKELVTAIGAGRLRSLETLNLSLNTLGDNGVGLLASDALPALKTLSLNSCFFGGEGTKALAKLIQTGQLHSLELLDLGMNPIGDVGVLALAEALESGELASLKVLHLNNRRRGDLSLMKLAKILKRQSLPNLELLDLGGKECSKNLAEAFRDAFAINQDLVANLIMDWSGFPSYETSMIKFRDRNRKLASILKHLHGEREVPACHGKVFLCGDEREGKTTLCKSLLKKVPAILSLFLRERSYRHEQPTRGIQIRHLVEKGTPLISRVPLTVAIWDLAGQHEYYTLHSTFLPDLAFADGKATTFVIVCNAKHDLSSTVLNYWMRFIASSSRRDIADGKRHVVLVLNQFNGNTLSVAETLTWKDDLRDFRDKFNDYLEIHADPFIVDARVQRSVKNLKSLLLNNTAHRLQDKKMPEICRSIAEELAEDVKTMDFPAVSLRSFIARYKSRYSASEEKLKAALEYLHESGRVIYFREGSLSEGVDPQRSLVVMDPDYFCQRVVGHLLLPDRMLLNHENPLRRNMCGDGSIQLKDMIRHLTLSPREIQDVVAILLRLGLCYRVDNERVLIPALLERVEIPIEWQVPLTMIDQWVMGFCLKVLHSETTLLPIAVFRRLQVELAQDRMCSNFLDSCYVVGKFHITFKYKEMMVLVEFSALEDRMDILVKPLVNNMDVKSRRERQVNLAHTIAEKLVFLAETWCPSVELKRLVLKPWSTERALLQMADRDISLSVDEVKRRVQEHGIGEKLNWPVGEHDLVIAIELLSRSDLGELLSSEEKKADVIIEAIVDLGLISQLDQGDVDDSSNPSHEHIEPSTSQSSEDREFWMVLEGVKNSLKRHMDNRFCNLQNHMDNRFNNVDKAILHVQNDLKTILDIQKAVLHRLQAMQVFSVQDKARSVPRFLYLTKYDDASKSWVRLMKLTNLFKEKMVLHFLCEARHSLHEVKGQDGVQISDLKNWAEKIAPWVEWSLRAAYIIGKIASQAVLPGLSQLISTFPLKGDSQEVVGISLTVAYLCSAAGLVGGNTPSPGLKTFDDLKGSSALRPMEAKGGLKDVLKGLIGELPVGEFHKKFNLRPVVVNKSGNVIWICDVCFHSYDKSNLVEEL